jgi:ADP-ribose pyrophosphatase YjhB (NUDIX family)
MIVSLAGMGPVYGHEVRPTGDTVMNVIEILKRVSRLLNTPGEERSSEDKEAVAEVLGCIDPTKPFGTPLFNAVAKLSVTVAYEAVLIRDGASNTPEVYLMRRSMTESAYPGEWHCPGSSFRVGEQPTDVEHRLAKTEFGVGSFANPGTYVSHFFYQEKRGWYCSMVHLVEVVEELSGKTGQWFPVDALPVVTVDHHVREVIPRALEGRWAGRMGGKKNS